MADITFKGKRTGKKMIGTLTWEAKNLSSPAIAGPHENGALPAGTYTAPRKILLDKENDPEANSYADKQGTTRGHCWMQVLEDAYGRNQLGVHPDGGDQGTKGCIGLRIDDTKKWYDAFYSIDKDKKVTFQVIDET